MPSFSDIDKSRVRFHLNYAADGVADGDADRLEKEMSKIRDNTQLNYLRFMLDSLDEAFNQLMTDGLYDSRQLIQGDINRSTVVDTPNDFRVWEERYLKKTDLLANQLNVANYQRPEAARIRFMRLGSTYSFTVPGIADTCTADRISMSATYS